MLGTDFAHGLGCVLVVLVITQESARGAAPNMQSSTHKLPASKLRNITLTPCTVQL